MCRGCAVDSGPGWGALWDQIEPDDRAYQRHRQRAVLLAIVAPYAVTIRDIGSDSFLLANRTGSSAVILGVRRVWEGVENLSRERVDVLNPTVLSRIDSLS